MSILIDSKTIMLALGIGYVIALILVSAYWHHHTNTSDAKAFIAAKFVQTLAWFGLVLRDTIPDLLSIAIANSVLFLGMTWEVLVLTRLQLPLRPRIKQAYLTLVGIGIAGFLLICCLNRPEHVRIAYCSVVMPIVLLPASRLAWSRASTMLMRIMGMLYLFLVAANLFRGAYALHSASWTSFYTPSAYQSATVVSLLFIMILSNTGFVLLLRERDNRELMHMASYDDLTGALNRRAFTAQAEQLLATCSGKRQSISYMLFDIDNFKAINDSYGHHAGDLALQQLTAQIRPLLGPSDLLVRYGGDEFGLLLPGKDEPASTELAERIRQSLRDMDAPGLPIAFTISMGVITFTPESSTRLEMLYTSCDKALYTAKKNGRNGIFRSQLAS